MNYYLLCSGSKGNCFVLIDEDSKIVIDCGSTKTYLIDSFNKINIKIDDFDALLLTHCHIDHISQLGLFKNIKKYASYNLKDSIQVIPNQEFFIKNLSIYPIALSHDCDICVGYIIRSCQEKLVYITDTGYLKDEYLQLIKDADYYIIESNHDPEMLMKTTRPYCTKMRILSDYGHLSNDKCAQILAKVITKRTKEIVLAHISKEANTRELAYQTIYPIIKDKNIILKVSYQNQIVEGGQ